MLPIVLIRSITRFGSSIIVVVVIGGVGCGGIRVPIVSSVHGSTVNISIECNLIRISKSFVYVSSSIW